MRLDGAFFSPPAASCRQISEEQSFGSSQVLRCGNYKRTTRSAVVPVTSAALPFPASDFFFSFQLAIVDKRHIFKSSQARRVFPLQ